MAKGQRPFNPKILAELSKAPIKPPLGVGAVAWRYTVLVPTEETESGKSTKGIATDKDLENLEIILTRHFEGLTILADSVGYGLRGRQVELNKHAPFVVYAAAMTPSELYFQTLRHELQEALAQEIILVERQEVWLH
jgi:hypothetical protein